MSELHGPAAAKAASAMLGALKEVREMLWGRPDIADKLRPMTGFAEAAICARAQAAIAAAEAAGISPEGR